MIKQQVDWKCVGNFAGQNLNILQEYVVNLAGME